MKITALIPVYQKPKRVQSIVRTLLSDRHAEKEIVVVVDGEATKEIKKALAPFGKRIKVRYNHERLGKSTALNNVALEVSSDVLLFLDNDIVLPAGGTLLEELSDIMCSQDIVELPKEAITKSLISRMMGYEFLSIAMTEFVMAGLSGRSPSMNGAAFAVRTALFRKLRGFRQVFHEDMDFAARAFRDGARFSYPPRLKVKNEVPDTIGDWLTQRKRWALNNILWLKENFFIVVLHMFKSPSFFLSAMLLFLPFIAYLVMFLTLKQLRITAILPIIFMTVQQYHVIAGLFLWLTHIDLIFVEGIIPTAGAILFSGVLTGAFARVLNFRFNPLEYLLFYFIYSPIWLIANAVMWIVVLLRIDIKHDWKV
ncbi:MAG: glycosyltransferase family 2 protein [Spirochaetota bacterium]